MRKRRVNRKLKKKLNILFKIIGSISLIICIIFCILLFFLNMLPTRYLFIIYIFLFLLYFILLLFIFIYKIKIKIKIISIIFLIIFDIIFGFGIKYISETINFVDLLNKEMYQKEEYYLMTLEDSLKNDIKEFKKEKIGIYKNTNSQSIIEK